MKESEDLEKITILLRHIRHVQDNCLILGTKLIQSGQNELGRKLIANSMIHDNSKFYGIEWQELTVVDKMTKMTAAAIFQHNSINLHHPEAWEGIKNMPLLYLAEMVCDWSSRSAESGSSLRDWVNGAAMERFGFNEKDEVYKNISFYVDLLVDKPFESKVKHKVKKNSSETSNKE